MLPVYQIVFYFFAAVLLVAGIMVITASSPVRAVLSLVLAFFASAVLWMLLQAEFLSLVLIFVYVGAVMTLFLFVVMMISADSSKAKATFNRYLALGVLAVLALVVLSIGVVSSDQLPFAQHGLRGFSQSYDNTQQMGTLLFTEFLLPFEIAGLILLVAMVSAITLAFYGRKPNTKSQNIAEQHLANRKDCLRVVKMKAERK